jgi:hypothetical protein
MAPAPAPAGAAPLPPPAAVTPPVVPPAAVPVPPGNGAHAPPHGAMPVANQPGGPALMPASYTAPAPASQSQQNQPPQGKESRGWKIIRNN